MPPSQQLVYEGSDLEALLQRVLEEHGPARIRPPERRRKGGVLGLFSREVYVISVDTQDIERETVPPACPDHLRALVEATADDLELGSGSPRAPERLAAPKTFDEVLARVAATHGGTGTGPLAPRGERAWDDEAVGEVDGDGDVDVDGDVDGDGPLPVAAAAAMLACATGFPRRLLPRGLDTAPNAIEAIFASLPEPGPLPRAPGALVAVVGPSHAVGELVHDVAAEVGCPPPEVAVASASPVPRDRRPHQVRSAAQAASLAPGWRRNRVAVVAVHAPRLGADQTWTKDVLHALAPSCVWGVVDATTKPGDVARWTDAVGGVDGLALTRVHESGTPAAVVSLGIPVVRLDAAPATPRTWAAVAVERLSGN